MKDIQPTAKDKLQTKKNIRQSTCWISVILFTLALFAPHAHATEKKQANPHAKTLAINLPKNAHAIYVGAGVAGGLIHLKLEKPTRYGNFYARLGQFYEGENMAAMLGYRYPYKLSGKDNNGVYIGVFGGHVESNTIDDERYYRLGGGIDISYVSFDAARISSAGVGLYFGQNKTGKKGSKHEPKAAIMLSLSMAIGFF